MGDHTFSIRIRHFKNNPLLMRKQFCVDVIHPGRGNVSKKDVQEKITKLYKKPEPNCTVLFGFKTQFGGGRTTGFCCVYDSVSAMKKFEQKYRQARLGGEPIVRKGRRATKELKNRQKKVRGKDKKKFVGKKK